MLLVLALAGTYLWFRRNPVKPINQPVTEKFATQFASVATVCKNTLYTEIEGFLAPYECDRLINISIEKGMVSSLVGFDDSYIDTNVRKSKQVWMGAEDNDITHIIREKVQNMVDTLRQSKCISDKYMFEDIQIVNYAQGGKYDPHYDGDECGEGKQCPPNQRICTVLIYLNDDFTGGYTRFPNLNISIKPKKGKALFFWVSNPLDGQLYKETLHGGEPVLSGEKWIATQWVRNVATK